MKVHSAQSLHAVHGPSAGAGRPSRKNWLVPGLTRLMRAIGALRRERAYRRAIAELSRLDPRLLSDIGLGEAEISGAVRFGRREPLPASGLQASPRRAPIEPARLIALRAGAERVRTPRGDHLQGPLRARAGATC